MTAAPGDPARADRPSAGRGPSRAPVVVVIGFFTVALTLVLLGAQRSKESLPPAQIATPGTPNAPRPVTVIMRDYVFDPTPLALVAGETVRFTIFDAGMLAHEFTLGAAAVQDAWAAADAAATPPAPLTTAPPASVPPETGGLRLFLRSGAQVTVDYTLPTDASLQLLCHLPGHLERGMIGRIELVAARG